MSLQITADRSSTDVPLNLVVDKNGGVAGLTAVVALRDGLTLGSYLDFADDTFKTSGWTLRQPLLTDLGGGFYSLAGGVDLTAITNLPAGTKHLIAEYEISGAETGAAIDVVKLTVAEASVATLLAYSENKLLVNIDTQKLELYDAAGTTIVQQWPLTTKGGELVTTQFGVQVQRGVPEL